MYKALTRNLNNFFKINKASPDNNYRGNIAEVLIGLTDINLYEQWKKNDIEKYIELSNIIFEIENNTDKYHTFKTLSLDLWGCGYDSQKSSHFSTEVIEEQLKLINLCLKGQYILT